MSGWKEWGLEMSEWREGDQGCLDGGKGIGDVWLERRGSETSRKRDGDDRCLYGGSGD